MVMKRRGLPPGRKSETNPIPACAEMTETPATEGWVRSAFRISDFGFVFGFRRSPRDLCRGLPSPGGLRRSDPSACAEELARFQATEQAHPMVDMDRVLQAKIVTGPYRAVAGDVLHLEMPKFPEPPAPVPGTDNRQIYNCRIAEDGTIVLPIVGPLAVQGKSLAEIEGAIASKYFPQYVATPLLVYVSVQEYRTEQVSIVGAVTQPGIHALRHDQMSLVALLMQAGGIAAPGAAVIRINRAADAGEDAGKVKREDNGSVLPLRGPSSTGWQAVFEREGPLRTTGWLRVEQENGRASTASGSISPMGPSGASFSGCWPPSRKGCEPRT